MGLLDSYFDPEQFGEGGGLLGRLLALPQMLGLYQPMPRQILQANGPAVNPQTWEILQFGRADVSQAGNGRARGSSEASSIAGEQPPGLGKIGYFEIPTNPNQAFGELLGIQERNEGHTVSRKDYVSGVREGNVRYNADGSLDVTNGTVVTFSYKDGRATTVTVTGDDIAHIDAKTGEVVIQKSF